MIAIIQGDALAGGGGPGSMYTSIYGKTVWVSQDHERATDVRAGLDMYDQEHPYQTLGAACADIIASGDMLVCIRLASGYYDEDVTLPPACDLFGEGDQCYVSRLVADGTLNGVWNIQLYNDASFSAGANLAPLTVRGSAQVFARNVRAADVYQDDNATQDNCCALVEGANSGLRAWNCEFACVGQDVTASGSVIGGVRVSGAGAVAELYTSLTFGYAAAPGQLACGVHVEEGGAKTSACALKGQLASATQSGAAAGAIATTGASSSVITGGTCEAVISGALTASLGMAAAAFGGAAQALTLAGVTCTVTRQAGADASRAGVGISQLAGADLRVIDSVWPALTTAPARLGGTGGAYAAEGVLGDGVRFPAAAGALLSGQTLWVDAASPDATDTRTGLSNYDRSRPFVTLAAAAAVALAGDQIQALAGSYVEASGVVIGAGVSLLGAGAAAVTISRSSTGDTVQLGSGASITGCAVQVFDDAAARGIVSVAAAAARADVCACEVIGNPSGAGTACAPDAASVLVIDGLALSLFLEYGVLSSVAGASVQVRNMTQATGSAVDLGVVVIGGELVFDSVNLPFCNTAGVLLTNTPATGQDLTVSGAVDGVSMAGTSSLGCCGAHVSGNVNDVTILDPSPRLSLSGLVRVEAINAPAAWWAAQRVNGLLSSPGAPHVETALGSFEAGRLVAPASVGLGAGLPTSQGLVVYRNTNDTVGAWSDITAQLIATFAAVDLFSAAGAGAAVFFGTDDPASAILLDITTAASPTTIALQAQYWDGLAWVACATQQNSELAPFVRRGGAPLFDAGRVWTRFERPSAALLTLNGSSKYWLRLNIAGALVTIPQAQEAAVIGDGVLIQGGALQYFGANQPALNLPSMQLKARDFDTTLVPGPASNLDYATNQLDVDPVSTSFADLVVDKGFNVFEIPPELDLSKPLTLTWRWGRGAGAGAGDVQWLVYWSIFADGDTLDGSLPTSSGNVITAVSGTTRLVQTEALEMTLRDFYVPANGAVLVVQLGRDATGGNPNDTYAAAAEVYAVTASGKRWQ